MQSKSFRCKSLQRVGHERAIVGDFEQRFVIAVAFAGAATRSPDDRHRHVPALLVVGDATIGVARVEVSESTSQTPAASQRRGDVHSQQCVFGVGRADKAVDPAVSAQIAAVEKAVLVGSLKRQRAHLGHARRIDQSSDRSGVIYAAHKSVAEFVATARLPA